MDDLGLRNLVLATLERLPLIAASLIGVAVHHGVVVLTGHVVDESHKTIVEFAVINLPEVKGLAQKIHVCADLEFLDSDEEIVRRMVRMIEWNISEPQNDLRVRVEDRWVTLTGHVGCSQDLERAEQFAKTVRGCAGFSNNLAISNEARFADASLETAA